MQAGHELNRFIAHMQAPTHISKHRVRRLFQFNVRNILPAEYLNLVKHAIVEREHGRLAQTVDCLQITAWKYFQLHVDKILLKILFFFFLVILIFL
jgi:hypothetical protein